MKIIIAILLVVVAGFLGFNFLSDEPEADTSTPTEVDSQTTSEEASVRQDAQEFVDGVISADKSEQSVHEVIEVTFAHVKPGEYSEVYVSVSNVEPGKAIRVSLDGVDVDDGSEQLLGADANGTASFTFRVYAFGMYHARTVIEGDTAILMRSISVD
ncbi:MAG: hypothetical protein ACI9VM_000781 [Candidatus Azotimanducaceae bacterium]|jgi:hypothetical protein